MSNKATRIAGIGMLPLLVALLLLSCADEGAPGPNPHSTDSADLYRMAINDPVTCQGCHPVHYAEWERSMHHYAVHDPVFQRLHELAQTEEGGKVGSFCVRCHAPLAPKLQGSAADPVNIPQAALHGVSCEMCHKMGQAERGRGIHALRLDNVEQGPIPDPMPNEFHESEYQPRYAFSDICAPCHDVLTPAGFAVENTNREWDASPYSAMGLECQDCHMPAYSGNAAISGPLREKLHRHTFVGVDVALTDFPGREANRQAVAELLRNSVRMAVEAGSRAEAGRELAIAVEIHNDRTGHNIPSGTVFEREMWLEVQLRDAQDNVLYQSGMRDPNGDLLTLNSEYVMRGTEVLDTDLTLFNGKALRAGRETPFFWLADELKNNSIPAFGSHRAEYAPRIPAAAQGELRLRVRLLFRAFPPYFLRYIGLAELVAELPVFEMNSFEGTIQLQ